MEYLVSVRAAFLAVLLSFATVAPALAQSASPSASNPAELEQRVSMARRYMAAIQFEKLMRGVTQASYSQIFEEAGLTPEKRVHLQQVFDESFAAVMPLLVDTTAALYAESFTLDELTQVVAFYESPVGRSLTVKSVMLTQRSNEIYAAITPRLEEEIMRRLCGSGGCDNAAGPTSNKRD